MQYIKNFRIHCFIFFQASEFAKSTLSINTEFSSKRTKLKITVPVLRETAQVRHFLKVHELLNAITSRPLPFKSVEFAILYSVDTPRPSTMSIILNDGIG